MTEFPSLDRHNVQFISARGIAAFSVVVAENSGASFIQRAGLGMSSAIGAEDWHAVGLLIEDILRTFQPELEPYTQRSAKERRFQPAMFGFGNGAFETAVDKENETVTVTIPSPAITMTASRKATGRSRGIHLRLNFQAPKEAADALKRFDESQRNSMFNDLYTVDFAFIGSITFAPRFQDEGIVSQQAARLLGDRIVTEYGGYPRKHRTSIVPHEGEHLVVFDGLVRGVLDIPLTEDEKRVISPEDPSIFAALILPGMGAIVLAYRMREVGSGRHRRYEHFIGAQHDLGFVLEYHEENSDRSYYDDDCDEPFGSHFRDREY